MACNGDEECDIKPGKVTPKKLPKQSGGGGHEFVTELPDTGDEGVEYVLMDDISDCSTYKGTYVYNEECGGWIATSGSGGGGTIERYTFEKTDTGWRAKRNNTVIFTYVDKDTIDTYENTANGFQITRNGVVIFTHTDGGGGDCKEYTITATDDGWVFKEDGVTKFTYTEPANDPSDGTYFTSGTLTEAITGTTTVSAGTVTGLNVADVVVGETLIYDEAGTVGRVTAVSGSNLTVETITTSPGERRGTRLGAVDAKTDLPATCAAAVAMGWQTPLAGDFAYVREDSTHDNLLTEYVIQNVDSSCNITWAYSHTLNAGNYVLDIYKYGDYPSGSPIPKNADGSVTLPKDENTKYVFEDLLDGTKVVGWRVKENGASSYLYTFNATDTDTTYTFSDIVSGGKTIGWKVVDSNGTPVYSYTDRDDISDGAYLTSATLDTTITNATSVNLTDVPTLVASDIVDGETLIYDNDGTVGVVTSHTATALTVETMTVSGSGDASSYVYETSGTLDTTIGNTTTVTLSTLSDYSSTTPTASDLIEGKSLVYDADGTAGLVTAVSGANVTVKTLAVAGSGGTTNVTYAIDPNGDELLHGNFALANGEFNKHSGYTGSIAVAHLAVMPFVKTNGNIEPGSTQGTFKVPAGKTIEVDLNYTVAQDESVGTPNVRVWLWNYTDNNQPEGDVNNWHNSSAYGYGGEGGSTGYAMSCSGNFQWTNTTGHTVELGLRIDSYENHTVGFRADATTMTVKEIGRVVDPINYLDKTRGLQDTPVGNIISYMGNTVPTHYLACDGTVYNVGDYPELEAFFLKEFGSVDYFGGSASSGTWAVPDLRGEFLRGTGANSHTWTDFRGSSAREGNGSAVGVHQTSTVLPGIWTGETNDNRLIMVQHVNGRGLNPDSAQSSTNFDTSVATGTNAKNSMTTAYTSRPTNTSVKYCIKCESTLAVILSEQFKVEVKLADGGAKQWANGGQKNSGQILNPSTVLNGDSSMINTTDMCFVAPVDGWYNITAFMTMSSKQSTGTAWIMAFALDEDNRKLVQTPLAPRNPGNTAYDGVSDQMECSGTVFLEAGARVQLGAWSANSDLYFGNNARASFVLLTTGLEQTQVDTMLLSADEYYSTDEVLVGSYLGKPLYKKTVTGLSTSLSWAGTQAFTSCSFNPSTHGFTNVEQIVECRGNLADNGSGIYKPNCGNLVLSARIRSSTEWTIYGLDDYTLNELTVYYTKTTDVADSGWTTNPYLINRPDLWEVGKEYNFGGGLYGIRATGTTTTPATSSGFALTSGQIGNITQDTPIVNNGGFGRVSSDASSGWTIHGVTVERDNKIGLPQLWTSSSVNVNYDIWFLYKKS